MTDPYKHQDGSRECRPVIELTPEQQATLDRLTRDPAALLAVNVARLEQITKFGHSDDADALEPIDFFPRKARDYALDAVDHARRGQSNLEITRLKLIKVAALAMAGIDRIDLIKSQDNAHG